MKLVITKEWLKRAIELEGDDEVAAGALARDPTHNSADEQAAGEALDDQARANAELAEQMAVYIRENAAKRGLQVTEIER